MQRLLQNDVLRPTFAVDVSRLGFLRVTSFLAIDFIDANQRLKFSRRACQHPSVAFLAEVSGAFDFEVSVVAKSIGEAHQVMQELLESEKCTLLSFEAVSRVRSWLFQRKYLGRHPFLKALQVYDSSGDVFEPSPLDERIISAVSSNPLASQRDFARISGCALATVHQSLKRLKSAGILKGLVYSVNFERYGAQFYSVHIKLKRFPPGVEQALFKFSQSAPHVTHFVVSLGAWDFELGVEVPSLIEMRALMDSLASKFGDLILFRRVIPRVTVLKFLPYPGQCS